MKRRLLIVLAALVLVFAGVNMASAACQALGKVVYVYLVPTSPTTQYAYIYVHQYSAGALPAFFYYFYTVNPSVISAAIDAESGNQGVSIVGNAASCPVAGVSRYGGIVQWLYTIKNVY